MHLTRPLIAVTALMVLLAVAPRVEPAGAAPPPPTPPATAAAAAAPATPINPSWARSPYTGATDARSAVDREGWTYTTSEILMVSFRPDGSPGFQSHTTAGLTGMRDTEPPDIAVTDDGSGVFVTGQLVGRTEFGLGQEHPVFLDPGPAVRAAFVVRLAHDGTLVWARLLPPGMAAGQIEVVDDTVVVAGHLWGSVTLDGLAPVVATDGEGFAAGLDPQTGTARWLTEMVVDPGATESPSVFLLDLASDDDSVAWLGYTPEGLAVSGAGVEIARSCSTLGSTECAVMADLDAATGAPLVVAPLTTEPLLSSQIAIAADGYALLGQDLSWPPPPAEPGSATISRLDAEGDVVWTRRLAGANASPTFGDVVVDANGDVIVAVGFHGTVTIGEGPGAPVINSPAGLLVVEYDATGGPTRYVPGTGSTPYGWGPSTVSLGVDGNDAIHLVADRVPVGTVTLGSGPGAVTIPGSWPVVATFQPDVSPLATFHPLAPVRVLDSRTATGGWSSKLVAGSPRSLAVGLEATALPFDATAVVLNLTVTDVSEMTYVTAWPTGTPRPVASNLNVVAGDTISNQVTVRLGDLRQIQLATAQGSVNLVADLLGYYASDTTGSTFHPVTPARLLDSRTPTGGWGAPLVAGAPRQLTVVGSAGIPVDATAVTLSVTATDTTKHTYLRVQPTGSVASNSNIAINAGQTISNLVTTKVGTGGALTFTNNTGSINVVADVVGWYGGPDGARFRPISPVRILDSRDGTGGSVGPWGQGTVRTVPASGVAVGDDPVTAITSNLTVTDTSAMSFLTLYPGAPRPGTSTLLFTAGQTIASAASSGLAPNGSVSIFNQLGSAHVVLDVNGYFTDS